MRAGVHEPFSRLSQWFRYVLYGGLIVSFHKDKDLSWIKQRKVPKITRFLAPFYNLYQISFLWLSAILFVCPLKAQKIGKNYGLFWFCCWFCCNCIC